MSKAVIFFAPGLEECEGLLVVDILRRAGAEVTIAAVGGSQTVLSSHRVQIVADAMAADIQPADYDACILDRMLGDTTNARMQLPDTTYVHVERRGRTAHNCQREFSKLAQAAVKEKETVSEDQPFAPIRSSDLKES